MNLDGTTITALGHSTFLIERAGALILIDPWLAGNPSCPEKYHDIDPDLVLVTHGHNDHIGDVLELAGRSATRFFGIFELTSWLGSKGVSDQRLVGGNRGGTVRFDDLGLSVTLTDARHSSSFVEADGTVVYLGEACGLVLSFDGGPTIYHAGDTCLFGDMALIAKLWGPDLAILPIGDRFTMDPKQAALAAELLGVEGAIPCHWGTFGLLTGTPEQFEAEVAALGLETQVFVLGPGETLL